MKNIPQDAPVATDPKIKVKRQRRRIYQETPSQAETKASTSTNETSVPEVVTQDDSASLCDKNIKNCSRKTERHHIPVTLRAERIIENSMAASMGLGILPLPLLDTAGIMGIQLYMIRELSKAYDVKFSLIRSQAFVTSLIGGLGSVSVATGLFGSLIKMIPVFGGVAGALTLPVVAGGVTYALGKVCIQSFTQGKQTPVSISQSTRRSFEEYLKKGIKTAKSLHNSISKPDN